MWLSPIILAASSVNSARMCLVHGYVRCKCRWLQLDEDPSSRLRREWYQVVWYCHGIALPTYPVISMLHVVENFCHLTCVLDKTAGLEPVTEIITARRYASAVLAVNMCLSVRPSVKSRSCTKMAKPRIRLTTPYDSPETLVFRCQKSWRNSHDITPKGGAK